MVVMLSSRAFSTISMSMLYIATACGGGDGAPTEERERAVRVELADAREETLMETVSGIGTLRAAVTVEVRPEIEGVVSEVVYEDGAYVERGELLFRLDDEKLESDLEARRSALKAARARLDNAERELARAQRLEASGVLAADQLDRAATAFRESSAEVERLDSEIRLLEERLADARLVAPVSGRLSESLVDVGDFAEKGRLLASLFQTGTMEITFSLPERFMGRLEPEQRVRASVDAYPEKSFEGEVSYVSPSVDELSRDFEVRARIANEGALLKPGAFASATVTVAELPGRTVVPEEALVATRDGYVVFVVREGRARRREVETGLRRPGAVEITEGIEPGERVVRSGHMRLSDGTPVEVEPEADFEATDGGGLP